MIRMRVWANARPMGWFGHAAGEYLFEYDPQWLAQPGGYVLAPQFALSGERYTGTLVRSYFENLLPEGAALDDVVSALALRDPSAFELLGQLGKDLPGVLSLLQEDALPELQQQYQPLPFAELSARLNSQKPLLVSNDSATMSLPGAQEKMGLRFDAPSKQLSVSIGTSPTTHILKPDTRQRRYQPSAINEYACMRLARAVKLPVPDVWLLRVPEAAYVVQRYDRVIVAGNIVSLHQFDGCQMLGHSSGWKYQRQGGLASLPKLVTALRSLRLRGSDMLQLQRWVMFNYLVGNADAHAKNLSVLVDAAGFRLAPFYDLLCVRAYSDASDDGDSDLALYIGDESRFDAVGAHSWEALCSDCGFGFAPLLAEFRRMAIALLPAWAKVTERIAKEQPTTPAEQALLARMTRVFETHCAAAISMTQR
jgi:serine/threonine-protein kinase HipA